MYKIICCCNVPASISKRLVKRRSVNGRYHLPKHRLDKGESSLPLLQSPGSKSICSQRVENKSELRSAVQIRKEGSHMFYGIFIQFEAQKLEASGSGERPFQANGVKYLKSLATS